MIPGRSFGMNNHSIGSKLMDWQSGKDARTCHQFMLDKQLSCDVIFEVAGNRNVGAHRYVLMSRSSVFFEDMRDIQVGSTMLIPLPNTTFEVLRILLRFLYADHCNLTRETVIAVLSLAKKYNIGSLVTNCTVFMKSALNVDNACFYLEQAHTYEEHALRSHCWEYILENGEVVLSSASFLNLCLDCLEWIISQNELRAREVTVFERVEAWAREKGENKTPKDENLRKLLGQCFYCIRFPLMDISYFASKISTRDILTAEEKLVVFRYLTKTVDSVEPFSSSHRQHLRPIHHSNIELKSSSRFNRTCGPMSTISNNIDSHRSIAIAFSCSASILLKGFQLFSGSKSDYDVSVRLYTESASLLHEETVLVSNHCILTDITCVRLATPVPLTQESLYTLHVISSSPNLYYGIDGQIAVLDPVTFTFHVAPVPGCSSSLTQGDLPGLLYETCQLPP